MMKALKDYNEMVLRPFWKWTRMYWKTYPVLLLVSVFLCIDWLDIKMMFIKKKKEGKK